MLANSCGSIEKEESGFSTALSRQKCFSTTDAPMATAATAAREPMEWSESPTGQPNLSFMSPIVARFISSEIAGYALEHFNNVNWSWYFRIVPTAPSTSSKDPIPVDRIIGFLFEAT